MTPFGARVRSLRSARGVRLAELAAGLQVTPAYLSALEHGRRGAPSPGLVHQVCEFFGLIWDDAEELARLARISHPKVRVDTGGVTPEQTPPAKRMAQALHPPVESASGIGVDIDRGLLARAHVVQVGFSEVRLDPDVRARGERKYRRRRLDVVAYLKLVDLGNDAVDRRLDRVIGEQHLGVLERGLIGLDRRRQRLGRGRIRIELLV